MLKLKLGCYVLNLMWDQGTLQLPESYSPFILRSEKINSIEQKHLKQIDIKIIHASIDQSWRQHWTPGKMLIDTEATWAIQKTHDPKWIYHLGPSPIQTSIPPPYHILAREKFEQIEIYIDPAEHKEKLFEIPEILVHHINAYHHAFILHAAGLIMNKKAQLFLGDSGAGKSTIAGLLECSTTSAPVLSDDRILVYMKDHEWFASGTPWHGTLPRYQAIEAPLSSLFFIEKDRPHRLKKILDRQTNLTRLLPVALGAWWLPDAFDQQMRWVESLICSKDVGFYILGFAPESSVSAFLSKELAVHGNL